MKRLKAAVALTIAGAFLLGGAGIASAGFSWCDAGSPPPMDVGIAPNPQSNPHGMPTPDFQNKNDKFTANPVVEGALVPPGMTKAAR